MPCREMCEICSKVGRTVSQCYIISKTQKRRNHEHSFATLQAFSWASELILCFSLSYSGLQVIRLFSSHWKSMKLDQQLIILAPHAFFWRLRRANAPETRFLYASPFVKHPQIPCFIFFRWDALSFFFSVWDPDFGPASGRTDANLTLQCKRPNWRIPRFHRWS